MGASNWNFSGVTCKLEVIFEAPKLSEEANASVGCDYVANDSDWHVVRMYKLFPYTMKFHSLAGVLSPELMKLPYLNSIDFAYNYLNGTIPPEWGLTQLQEISLLGNRLTGKIPPELGNITTLTKLDLEANQLSGTVPSELGKLFNLKSLILSSNQLTGTLPTALAELRNLTNFRINDNNFSGSIPDFIQNWRQLTRLEMVASGLEGPIPSNISLLKDLTDLRITDITGPAQGFPPLNNASGLQILVLRNCNISGELHAYVWQIRELELLDASFNKLASGISPNIIGRRLRFVFLTGNMLSGDIPDSLLLNGASMNTYINLFRSSSTGNPLKDILACTEDVTCPRYGCSLHVNSGGNDLMVGESNGDVLYEGDANVEGSASRLYISNRIWGFSSTGDFMDDNVFQNTRYIATLDNSTSLSSVYTTARLSPLSLVYFSHCLENGEYAVNLHFAELQFSNDTTYRSLGRRVFDVYIQGHLVKKDFNIEDEARGMGNPVVILFNASVTNNILEIRFYWAGKGTTRFPRRGVYGPLVSAISVNPYFETCSDGGNKKKKIAYVGIAVGASCFALLVLVVICWKCCLKHNKRKDKDFEGMELKTISFSLKQLKSTTGNFSSRNKIGEGGFGPVYKGTLSDGTVIAVKQLSSHSRQGNREFLNEACQLGRNKKYEELFDEGLGSKINKEEAETMVKVAILCTNGSPSIRPMMSEVVNMLEGRTYVPEIIPEASGYTDDLRFKAMRDFREDKYAQSSQTHDSTTIQTDPLFPISSYDLSEIETIDTR
ncbi:hypothetical protein L6452_30855 [Arctium lappa]|uniref:Uncharacterized protein n=1 Tax=Arctium lappa TaxID=4217 RepID=A0ACB8ZKH4_ARCLA|nr:hypothetical protein L6452_30855 [Arctium lappa]